MKATFGCQCGAVRGEVEPAGPVNSVRAVCYCDDCQAFAHFLGKPETLDAQGGSDIVAVPPGFVRITQGADKIDAVRLSPKGLHRFRATCCDSHLANSVSAAIPFAGVAAAAFRCAGGDPDAFGPPKGAIMGEFAIGGCPPGAKGSPLRFLLPTALRVLGWKLSGKGQPNPFFAPGAKATRFPVTVLTQEQRDNLRPMCGPIPV